MARHQLLGHTRIVSGRLSASAWVNISPSPALAVGADGRITAANDAIARCLAATRRQLLATALTAWAVDPAALQNFLQNGDGISAEFCLRGADGSERWIEMTIGKQSTAGGTLLSAFDVTARRTEWEKLDEENRRYRDIIGVGGGTLYEMNADLTLIRMWERDPASDQPVIHERKANFPDDVIDPTYNPEGLAETQRRYEAREPVRNLIYRRPGQEVYRMGNSRPFYDKNGVYQGRRGVSIDVTAQVLAERALASLTQDVAEQRRIEQVLREAKDAADAANLAKSQFLANMSHELRTPLNAIIGFSEALELGLAEPLQAKQVEYVGFIHQSGQHLCDVINDILDLAKVDAGKLELYKEHDVNPREIIEKCTCLMKGQAAAASVKLSTNFGQDLPTLVADPVRLRQILLNLLSNAIKFTAAGGSITVSVKHGTRGTVIFEVRDTGIGMSADEIEIALQPFGQVDTHDTRRYQGTGLGLPLARRLAELHNGSLEVRSTKGRGTAVTIKLPGGRVRNATRPAVSSEVAA